MTHFNTNIDDYPSLKPLVENWQAVLEEYQMIAANAQLWPQQDIHNGRWDTYGLKHVGKDLPHECPKTAELIAGINGVFNAAFSILRPGALIHPHEGYTGWVLRSHLGLVCPSGASITVGGERYEWSEGEMVVFDDTTEHWAENKSGQDRVILILDFIK